MADNASVSVEFQASTAAAISEVSALSTSIRENTNAATVAGSAHEQLGKDVARTRAQQIEATAATRAAQQALAEHTATVAAFGARSAEATASAAKLSAAEHEAARAAKAAADALARTAAEVSAVAKAEDGDLSPATKRAAAQIARMGETAQKTAADLQRMELQQKKGSAGFDVMGMASGKLLSVLGPAALGGTLIALASGIGEAAQATLQYQTAIDNLPFSLDGARAATQGLISDHQLVTAASAATSLKVTRTSADFEKLAEASVKLAAKLGQPADQLLNNLVTALGRGSTELLDNAGIVLKTTEAHQRYAESIGLTVDQLSAEEKAGAFKAEAFKAITEAADATTMSYDSNAAAVVRLKVTSENAWSDIKNSVVDATGAIGTGFDDLLVGTTNLFGTTWIRDAVYDSKVAVGAWGIAANEAAVAAGAWGAEVVLGAESLAYIQSVLNDKDALGQAKALYDIEHEKNRVLGEEADFLERQQRALQQIAKEQEAFLDAQARHSVVYGPEEAPKKKAAAKKKKAGEMLDPGDVRIARTFDGVEQTELVADAAPDAAAEGRAEAEAALIDRRELLAEREMELLDAQASREAERVDAIFYTLEIEDEAETRRAELQNQRVEREMEYARWQVRSARTDAQREQAQTRLEAAEHRKRLVGSQRAAAEEAKLVAARQRQGEMFAAHTVQVGGVVIDATIAAVQGQRGALAQGLADFAAGKAKEFGLRALGEFALAAVAAASYNYPGAAAHTAAGGMALGVAAAAGGAAVGLGAAANSAGASPSGRPASSGPSVGGGAANVPGSATAPRMGGERERLERQDVPISYREPTASPGVVINIGTYVGGKGSEKDLADLLNKTLTRHKAQGPRP